MRFISSRRVCRGPSEGLLFFRASRRKDVHCWIRLYSMNTSTIWRHNAVTGHVSRRREWNELVNQ